MTQQTDVATKEKTTTKIQGDNVIIINYITATIKWPKSNDLCVKWFDNQNYMIPIIDLKLLNSTANFVIHKQGLRSKVYYVEYFNKMK